VKLANRNRSGGASSTQIASCATRRVIGAIVATGTSWARRRGAGAVVVVVF
jgi:hypothetical protein